MRKLEAMFIEFQVVLKAKGIEVELAEVMEMLDYHEWEQETYMEVKMEYERNLNHYNGLANAIKCYYNNNRSEVA